MQSKVRADAGRDTRRNPVGWLIELLAKHIPLPAFSAADDSSGKREPPRSGAGQRATFFGLERQRRCVAPDYRPGFGWQSLALVVILLVIALIVSVPGDLLSRILHGPPPFTVLRPDVVVVSGRWSDNTAVTETVRPRGYRVRTATSVEVGLKEVRSAPERIGIIVIDAELRGAKQMAEAARTVCPDARLVLLSGPRDAASIAHRLVEMGLD